MAQAARRDPAWTVMSILLLLFGSMQLLSVGGGALFFGPGVMCLGWFLARRSPNGLRIAWSVLAGLLTGLILWLLQSSGLDAAPAQVAVASLAGLVGAALLFERTTRPGFSVAALEGRGAAVAATFIGAYGLAVLWLFSPSTRDQQNTLLLVAVSLLIMAFVAYLWLPPRLVRGRK
jgi:hypothetical protein